MISLDGLKRAALASIVTVLIQISIGPSVEGPTLAQNTDSRLPAAAAWAEAQSADPSVKYKWGSGTATLCERFIENAFGTQGQYDTASDPEQNGAFWDMQDRGLQLDPNQPGLIQPGVIVYFEANSSNGGAGHAGIYVGNGEMISVGDLGVVRSKVTDWSDHVAPLLGFMAPRDDWPGLPLANTAPGLPDGALIKGTGATIYVFSSGQKHVIPDWFTFLSQGGAPDLANVQVLSEAALAAIVDGPPIPTAMTTPTAGAPQPAPGPAPQQAIDASFAPRGQTQEATGEITTTGQKNKLTFAGHQGSILELRATRSSGVTLLPGVTLIDPTGHTEAEVGTGYCGPEAFLQQKLASSGTYTIVIQGACGSQGPYHITWSLDRVGHLVGGSPVSAAITGSSQHDRYTIDARQGQELQIAAKRSSGVSLLPGIVLVDPTGHTEAEAGTGYCDSQAFMDRKLASTGTYIVIIEGACGSEGPYDVSATFT